MHDHEPDKLTGMELTVREDPRKKKQDTGFGRMWVKGGEYIQSQWLVILLLLLAVAAIPVVHTAGIYTGAEGTPRIDLGWGLFMVLAGLLAGWLGGLIGTGGCAILLPVFTFGMDYPAPIAIGTTLFVVIFTAFSGAYGHYRQGNLDTGATVWMAPCGVLGVLLGSWLFTGVADRSELICFILGITFLIPTVRMIWEGLSSAGREFTRFKVGRNLKAMAAFSMMVGFLSGLVGLGGGYLLVPGLIYVFSVPIYATMGTSLATVFPLALVGGSIKLIQGYVALDAALLVAAGTIIGAQVSAATIKKYQPNTLKLIFGVYFLSAAVKYILAYL